ncbi:MAG TPA: N-acetyltransferase [Thermoanaerobaculia bacterium]|nr:N-acetyltransferase [Thermoanaerobaculia bacterium]
MPLEIRPAVAKDRDRILAILVGTGRFTQEEIDCAIELVDLGLTQPEKKDYVIHVATDSNAVGSQETEGYVCFGPTPLTDGVYDLYWIAVDPRRQGQGVGKLLLKFVENEVRSRNGRMLLIETSSKETYGATIRFYESNGYEEISRIKDFYRIEDDKIVFCKQLR